MKAGLAKGKPLVASGPAKFRHLSRFRWFRVVFILICFALSIHLGFIPSLPGHFQPNNSDREFIYELANKMRDFYELLIKMHYLNPDGVAYPPHTIDITLAKKLNMSDDAVILLQLLPYVRVNKPMYNWVNDSSIKFGTSPNGFVFGTSFVDWREGLIIPRITDPFGDEDDLDFKLLDNNEGRRLCYEQGMCIKPWHVVLTHPYHRFLAVNLKTKAISDHQSKESKTHLRGSFDPVLKGTKTEGALRPATCFDLDEFASRPAIEALGDYMQRRIDLEYLPGFLERNSAEDLLFCDYQYDSYKELYIKHGWPSAFNGSAFDAARREWDEMNDALFERTKSLHYIQPLEAGLNSNLQKKNDLEEELNQFPSTDDPEERNSKGRTKADVISLLQGAKEGIFKGQAKLQEAKDRVEQMSEADIDEVARIIRKYGYHEQTIYPWN
ncbi:hypothetical protein F5884DRAFT_881551 [Xylogone sp. PMI_703]|nr:hypothetical protein F5884DRAFT_881551 [Xylogone sp. PMI_703]